MTNDERREVAAELRKLAAVTAYVHLPDSNLASLLFSAIHNGTEWDVSDRNPDGLFLNRLADLIEPEERTCERGIEMFSHAYPNEIVCDSDCVSTYVFPLTCGHEVELLENKWPSYCPHCGARVVADD